MGRVRSFAAQAPRPQQIFIPVGVCRLQIRNGHLLSSRTSLTWGSALFAGACRTNPLVCGSFCRGISCDGVGESSRGSPAQLAYDLQGWAWLYLASTWIPLLHLQCASFFLGAVPCRSRPVGTPQMRHDAVFYHQADINDADILLRLF